MAPGSPVSGLGLALLVRQGMAAWVQALQEQARKPVQPPGVSGGNRASVPQGDLVLALVALVLGGQAEASHV